MGIDNSSVRCEINLTELISVLSSDIHESSYVLCGPILATVVIFGLLGNLLSMTVFIRTKFKPKVYYYLIVLTFWDIMLLISSFLLYSLPNLMYGLQYTFGPYVRVYPICYALSHATHSGSIWTMIAFALERYYALGRPFIFMRWNGEKRAKVLLSVVALFAVLYRIPKFFELKIHSCFDLSSFQTVYFVEKSQMRENTVYKSVYKVFGDAMFFSVGPTLILLSLTVAVTLAFRRNKKFRLIETKNKLGRSFLNITETDCQQVNVCLERKPSPKWNGNDREENGMHLMLVSIMVKYCVCHTLPMVLNFCETLMHEDQFGGHLIGSLVDVSNVLVVLNSSCNFVIYLAFGVKFRRTFRTLFPRRRTTSYYYRTRSSLRPTVQYVSSWDMNSRKMFEKTSIKFSRSSVF